MAVTFTNKATKEMQERISKLLEENKAINRPVSVVGKPFVATFHGLGAYIIKENFREAGVKKYFSIYDREDSKRLVKEALVKIITTPSSLSQAKFWLLFLAKRAILFLLKNILNLRVVNILVVLFQKFGKIMK